MAFFSLWIFMWTDGINDATGRFFEKLSDADTLRMDTLRYVQSCLGLSETNDCEPDNSIIRSFRIIGEAICEFYSESEWIAYEVASVTCLTFSRPATEASR